MKPAIVFVLFLDILLSGMIVSFAGCKKSSSGNPSNNAGSITATLNGTAWSSNLLTMAIYYTSNDEFQLFGIQHKGADSSKFGLLITAPVTLNKPVGPDTPINSFGQFNDVVFRNMVSGQSYDGMPDFGGRSTLMVTALDSTARKISGTFSGVLYNVANSSDSLVVTNGSFNTSYTVQ